MTDPYAPLSDVQQEEEKSPVPVGSVVEVLQWVGDDKERAALALAEEKQGKNRKGITEPLGELVS